MPALLRLRFYYLRHRDVQVTLSVWLILERYFEDVIICLLDPFMSKHFDGRFPRVGIAIAQAPSEDTFAVTDTQDAEIADFVHASRVNAATIDRINVPCSFNDEQNRGSSLFKIKQNCSSNLTFIRHLK